MRDVVSDLLLPGRGVAIAEYRPTVEGDAVTAQGAFFRYLHWKDFLTNFARIWDEVWWCGYRAFLTKDEVRQRYGEKVADNITLDERPRDESGRYLSGPQRDAKATIWTIWSKRHGEVFQVSPGYQLGLLARMAPPVTFENFFPVPRPVQATTANDSIYPVPDFALYQDQADEIDMLTNRIYKLSESLRLRGLYPADMDSVKRLLSSATDTELIPVENWAMLGERGGAENLVAWFPLGEVSKTLATCIEARERAKQALYEVTGIADIMRGATQEYETAQAQQIKSQWGALRVRDRQRDVQRFARDAIRLIAEIIAEHFSQETLAQMSGVKLLTEAQKQQLAMLEQVNAQRQQMGQPPVPAPPIPPEMAQAVNLPSWDQVIALLRNDKLRSFQIDVETDSTVELDQQAQQQSRTAFITAVTQFLQAAAPIAMQAPQAAPLLGQLLLFGVRGWNGGEQMEPVIESFVQGMLQQASQPKPPDPALQAKTEQAQAKLQGEQMKLQGEAQRTQVEAQTAMGDQQLQQMQMALDARQLQADAQTQEHEREMAIIAQATEIIKARAAREAAEAKARGEKTQ
jgi:hypothetical protein